MLKQYILLERLIDKSELLFGVIIVAIATVAICYVLWRGKSKTANLINIHANGDEITGYSNFSKFVNDAAIMLKYDDLKYAVGYIDISNFKTINDFYGRSKGDRVLKNVADRVHDIVVPDGIFARIFADRFVFLMPYLDIESLKYVIETYLSEIEFEIEELKETIKINCNCGIYEVKDYSEDINAMVDKAAIAAGISKQSIEKMVTVLHDDVSNRIITNQKYTYMMKKALDNREFVVYIQPKVSLRNGRIVGGEALVRWMSAENGMIPPNDFIPLFEQNGFVTKVDFYVLERVCSMLKKRTEWGKTNVPISVNQSRMHIYDNMYINKLINTIDKYGVSKDDLIFELTESALTDNINDMILLIKRMSTLGYKVSMDDFGSGYSSLNTLNILPINELKIDKKFLDDASERSRFIIKSIISMSHGLGISVVCEGVEQAEQVNFLRKVGCDVAQGYFYSKPVPMGDFEKMLDADMKKSIYDEN